MRDLLLRLWREEHGWGRIWTGLAMAIALAGGGLVYQQVTQSTAACALPNYPDASCTGVPSGVSLTSSPGSLIVTTNGATVDGLNVGGSIVIRNATGVTIQNSKAEGIVIEGAALTLTNPRLTIQDTEINCPGASGDKGVQASNVPGGFGDHARNFTAIRVNVHNCEDAFFVDDNFTVRDSYVHDLVDCPTCHNDGFQIFGEQNGHNIIIQHNRIYAIDTSGMQFNQTPTGPPTFQDVTVTENLLAGGIFTLYCPQVPPTNFNVTNNAFSTIFFPTVGGELPSTECADDETWSGNFVYETNAVLPPDTAP